ncbi:Gfo/Idh/MocA family protein [Anthocerotibacter panamensis]|uniref:Gfo/Idh/MocA family protein n=1 Tax=Anthocerotibacter panamensis TaxID=2857077 RepID=UPI001C403A57|nr:Gfo/Idh/MocA family oxidoreductase [Anthocerotibacter panamensis]
MAAALGVAHIGCGAIGIFRAEAVAQTPGLKLVVVADVRQEAAEPLARRFGCAWATDWEKAVSRPDVDMVIVSTPPHLHATMTLTAIAQGKHVLCEKPLAHTLEDAHRMCDAAQARGVFLKTGFNHRYFPSMAFARSLIDQGRLGDVISVRAYAGHPGGKEFGPAWVTDGRVTGGGSLVDNGIHILDLTRFFLGEVATGKGYVANLIWPFPAAEDNSFALFRSAQGAIAQVQASWTEWRGYVFWVETVGTKGYVRASYPPMFAEWGETTPGNRAKRRYNLFPAFQVQERLFSWRWTIVQSFVQEMTDFARGIQRGNEVPATGQDGLKAMAMAHAIYRSSQQGGDEVSVG